MSHYGRDYWTPSFDLEIGRMSTGDGWPSIMVRKWEENDIGERRLVASFIIPAGEVAKHVGTQTPKEPA